MVKPWGKEKGKSCLFGWLFSFRLVLNVWAGPVRWCCVVVAPSKRVCCCGWVRAWAPRLEHGWFQVGFLPPPSLPFFTFVKICLCYTVLMKCEDPGFPPRSWREDQRWCSESSLYESRLYHMYHLATMEVEVVFYDHTRI